MRSYFILILIFLVTGSYAKQINEKSAESVALNFLHTRTNSNVLRNTEHIDLVYTEASIIKDIFTNSSTVYFYVFNISKSGFVIVSGDDIVYPVLGYSDEGNFNPGHLHSSIRKWLDNYKDQIRYAIENDLRPSEEITNEWEALIKGNEVKTDAELLLGVSPLVQTKWDQSPYYNDYCPYDNQYSDNAVTGCVATAMAQIMKYWEYPETGAGFHSYNHSKYGTLTANFGNTSYKWSSMPAKISSANDAIATLMYHCGVSVEMDYNVGSQGGSGAQTFDVVTALKTYFGYPSSVEGKYRTDYTESQWKNLIKTELDAARPVQYAGTGSGGGHSFVCDGYDNNDYFHFNWGWSGSEDGYFNVNALNPGSLGTGGGTGGFNTNQRVIIGIKSPTGVTPFNLEITEDVTPSDTQVPYGNAFSVTTNITNYGSNTFTGDYCAAAFDKDGYFIDYIEIKTGKSLSGGNTYVNSLVFSTTGNFSLLPGSYDIYIFYRPTGGNWKIISSSDNSYYYTTTIDVVNYNDIEMNSDIKVTPATFVQGSPASVNLNILNDGTDEFFGDYDVSLYTLEGDFVETIGTYSESSLPGGYTYTSPYLTFSSNAIKSEPGSYLLAVEHKWGNGNWELTGSSYFQNPIIVDVQAPALQPDQYEANNTLAKAYNLPITFSGNNANKKTTGSNCHTGTDYDYYKITLPTGFKYTITPRLHDEYNSGNGNTYSLDGIFSYTLDGGTNWSDAFDDIITSPIVLGNGGTVQFLISPYFTGETGTYLFDIDIVKSPKTAVFDPELEKLINIYPNPAKDLITIAIKDRPGNYKCSLYYAQGKQIDLDEVNTNEDKVTLKLPDVADGLYLLKLNMGSVIITKKIIISK